MPKRLLLLSTLALTACAALPEGEAPAPPRAATARPTEYGRFPEPTGAITVGPGSSVADLLSAWEGVTGLTFSADPRTRSVLEATLLGIGREVTLEADSIYAWAGALLVQNGFVMADLTGTEPRLVGVYSSHSQTVPQSVEIPVESLSAYALHPALMVQTVVQLEHVDVRTLGNSMRGISSGPSGRQAIIPVGNTNTVLLHGPVRQVTELVETLLRVNADAARKGAGAQG